jgi:phosphosulfolactate phosphohydrolase-like enzyme
LNKRKINLFFISAGTYGKYSREDSLLAGKFINEISNLNINIELSDSSELIRSNFLQNEANLSDYLKSSKHAKYLRELSLSKDVEYCISNKNINVLPVIYPNNVIGL